MTPPRTERLDDSAESTGTRAGDLSALALATLLIGAGQTHFLAPSFYRGLIPPFLGPPDPWVYGSGVAEVSVGAAIIPRRTRRAAGFAAALLFVVVFPGNIFHAWQSRNGPRVEQAGTLLRLPLQIPLIWWAWRVARQGGNDG